MLVGVRLGLYQLVALFPNTQRVRFMLKAQPDPLSDNDLLFQNFEVQIRLLSWKIYNMWCELINFIT